MANQSVTLTNGKLIQLVAPKADLDIPSRGPGGKYEIKDLIYSMRFPHSSVVAAQSGAYSLRPAPESSILRMYNSSGSLSGTVTGRFPLLAKQLAVKWSHAFQGGSNSFQITIGTVAILTVSRTNSGFVYAVIGRSSVTVERGWTYNNDGSFFMLYSEAKKSISLYVGDFGGDPASGLTLVATIDVSGQTIPAMISTQQAVLTFNATNSTNYSGNNNVSNLRVGSDAAACLLTLPA